MVNAALSGELENVNYKRDNLFHVDVPENCPGVPSEMLWPKNTWKDKEAYDKQAQILAKNSAMRLIKLWAKEYKRERYKSMPG